MVLFKNIILHGGFSFVVFASGDIRLPGNGPTRMRQTGNHIKHNSQTSTDFPREILYGGFALVVVCASGDIRHPGNWSTRLRNEEELGESIAFQISAFVE